MDSTSTTLTASTIIDEEEREHLFHTQIWVQNNPLYLIMDNGSQKNFISEDLVKTLGLVTTPHPQPYNIGWMKDGQELRITRQCRLTYFINPFQYEVLFDMEPISIADTLFGILICHSNLGTKTQSHKRFQTIKHENGIMVLQ